MGLLDDLINSKRMKLQAVNGSGGVTREDWGQDEGLIGQMLRNAPSPVHAALDPTAMIGTTPLTMGDRIADTARQVKKSFTEGTIPEDMRAGLRARGLPDAVADTGAMLAEFHPGVAIPEAVSTIAASDDPYSIYSAGQALQSFMPGVTRMVGDFNERSTPTPIEKGGLLGHMDDPAAPKQPAPEGGLLDDMMQSGDVKAERVAGQGGQRVAGTWGDPNRPDVEFEGVGPGEFTPGQMGRFGKMYDAHNMGPLDEEAWYTSLQPYKTQSGQEFMVPGGLDSAQPFTYWDDLYMKAQGINPNDLTPEQHLGIHNRMVAGKQAPPGGWSDEQINNQLQMALLSPNNPLTPNEFAVAATMAKHGENALDLNTIAQSAPGYDYAQHPMYGETTPQHQEGGRRQSSNEILQRLGTQGSEKGGTGVSGNQDYTTLTGLGQMMLEKPEFFRFKGAGEGSIDPGDQWLNFVDRLQTQVPGLAGKTGSFGAVWQDPAHAATSAMDRHMLSKFRDKVFASPAEEAAWTAKTLDKWNKPLHGMGPAEQPTTSLNDLRMEPGGTNFFTDQMFGYVNKTDSGKMRAAERKGKNFIGPANKAVSERVPEHLKPANAGYVKEPLEFNSLGPAYRRGIDANVESMNQAGATGVFSDQWRVWDKIRNRLEPHEIMQPGLADVPRMSPQQQADALATHGDLGYLNYTKDPEGNLQAVRPSMFKEGEALTPARARMKQMLKGVDPSKLAYFSMLLGIPLAGAGALGGGDEEERNNRS